MIIYAPYPTITTTLILPNPEFGNTRRLSSEVQRKYAMSGIIYTHVKRTEMRQIQVFQFTVTRQKSKEVFDFYQNHIKDKWLIEDHNNDRWTGYCMTNPLVLQPTRRWNYCPGDPNFSNDAVAFELEFEGVQI